MPNNTFTPQWRPKIHFTPERNWMNDPNGLVFYQGRYHLFYQYNPYGVEWGNMNWGHASSEDLIHWQHHPVAIEMDNQGLGYIYSGSAVVDVNNTSGLQTTEHPPLVALFTHTEAVTEIQRQSLAYSLDGGDNWQQYAKNPVIENPGLVDFRDPKVFWYEPSKLWIMVLTAGHRIDFYQSDNLLSWSYVSTFGEDEGSHAGEWECPDLFPLITKEGISKWILLVSLVPGGPNGGSGTQYFVGEFDGKEFVAEHQDVRWLDYGPDNYAGVTWDGKQNGDNRRTLIAWMSNWVYAADMPTFPWNGAMCLPRDLFLNKLGDDFYLANLPAKEIGQQLQTVTELSANTDLLSVDLPQDNALELAIEAEVADTDKLYLILSNDLGEQVEVKYLPLRQKLIVDRSQAGWKYKLWRTPRLEANTLAASGKITAQLILDTSSLEIFWLDGTTSMTMCLLPTQPFNKLEIMTAKSTNKIISLAKIG